MNYLLNLIVDIETNAFYSFPYYPLNLIMQTNKDKLLAIKTIETLSVL